MSGSKKITTSVYYLGCGIIISLFFYSDTDARPTLPHILSFPFPSGHANIAQKIAQCYEQFGILLLDDADGSAVRSLASMPNQTPEDIMLAILQKWIQGEGRQPISWETLITAVQETGFDTLARDIRSGLPNLLQAP